jgi:hypothetical protein
MLSSSNPGILLSKLKSRGLSGLAVRHRRLTSNEFEHPHLEDESPVLNVLSHSPGHTETGADLSPLSTAVSSPVHVSLAEPYSSPARNEHPRTVSSPERFAPDAAGLSTRFNLLDYISSLIRFIVAVAAWNSGTTTSDWVQLADAPPSTQVAADANSLSPVPAVDPSSDGSNGATKHLAMETAMGSADDAAMGSADEAAMGSADDAAMGSADEAAMGSADDAAIGSACSNVPAPLDETDTHTESALRCAEQKAAELQLQLQDRESEVLQLRRMHQDFTERFANLESSVSAVVKSSQQRHEKGLDSPAFIEQLQHLMSGLSSICATISNTEARVRVELLKHESSSLIVEKELAQALAQADMLRQRNTELEQAVEKDCVNGYAVPSRKFTSREKEFEAALQELKNEVTDRDKCILCMMEQMNQAAAEHEAAVLLSTTLLHQQKNLNADIERDRQRLLQVISLFFTCDAVTRALAVVGVLRRRYQAD